MTIDDENGGEDFDGVQVSKNYNYLELTDNYEIRVIIEKVRKIVRTFRKSPTKNDVLQMYVKTDHGKELQLILDWRTRWISLLNMLESFVLLENSIKKAIINLKIIPLLDTEYEIIKNIANILQPIKKITVEALCRRDMDLCKADVALKFMLCEIHKINSSLSNDLENSPKVRIKERRTFYSGILNFLNNPNSLNNTSDDCLKNPGLSEVQHKLEKLLKRLYHDNNSTDNQVENIDDDDLFIAEVMRTF